jgi:methylenetetrahydrofolate reductase (NADPH)
MARSIKEIFTEKSSGIRFSCEFFPPKNPEEERVFNSTLQTLMNRNPRFVSVTYGAGGSTHQQSLSMVTRLNRKLDIPVVAHLTCAYAPRDHMVEVLKELDQGCIRNLLALRGDPPQGSNTFSSPPGGFNYASELVAFIKERYPHWCIGVAGYPESHPESPSPEKDLEHLKEKVEAGANFIITQLFFDNKFFFDFLERCRSIDIEVPVIPGILPVTSLKQVLRFTSLCGASIPPALLESLEVAERNQGIKGVRKVGIDYAIRQCRELAERGVDLIHFYTLNRSPATVEILGKILQDRN